MNLDYEILRLVSWILLVLCMIGFAICDGIILGVSMLLAQIAKTGTERKQLIATLTPSYLGQQVWLLTLVTLLMAAWPIAYAVGFSSFQLLLQLLLLGWLCRPLAMHFRLDRENPDWQRHCDTTLIYGSLLSAALLGIISGNLLKGVPFHLDSDMRIIFLGDFWGLLSPFALSVAALSISMLLFVGANFLQLKTQDDLYVRSRNWVFKTGAAFLILFAVNGLWVARMEGYHIITDILPNSASNPLNKFVKRSEGLWLDNYEHQPTLWLLPAVSFISALAAIYFSKIHRAYWALMASLTTVGFAVLTLAISMFPFLLPSNRSLNSSLTIWDASASENSLEILALVSAIALPLLAIASRWAFGLKSKLPT